SDARSTHLVVSGLEGAKLVVDGADRGSLPAHIDALSPGKHEIAVPSTSFSVSTVLSPGQLVTVDVPLAASPHVGSGVSHAHANAVAPAATSATSATTAATAPSAPASSDHRAAGA